MIIECKWISSSYGVFRAVIVFVCVRFEFLLRSNHPSRTHRHTDTRAHWSIHYFRDYYIFQYSHCIWCIRASAACGVRWTGVCERAPYIRCFSENHSIAICSYGGKGKSIDYISKCMNIYCMYFDYIHGAWFACIIAIALAVYKFTWWTWFVH